MIVSMFALKNVAKSYGDKQVLSGATLNVQPKDAVCIVGAGGSGKSTILKLLVRAEDPTSGSVEVDGIDLAAVPPSILQLYRRRVGIVFQEPVLLEHATLRENVALPLELFGTPQSVVDRTVDDLLSRMNLTSKANVLAGELSLSEQSLTGIARAIVTAPMVIVADEPLLSLDPKQAETVIALLMNMHKKGTTLIILSRTDLTAGAFNARIAQLKDGIISDAVAAQAARAPVREPQAIHRILEDEEKPVIAPDEPEHKDEPPSQDSGAKKIRITGIGSL